MRRESKKTETAVVAAIPSDRDHKLRIASAPLGMLSRALLFRKSALLFGPGTVRAHSTLRTNEIRSISLKTIGVATLDPSRV
jgi:hypothetical protein